MFIRSDVLLKIARVFASFGISMIDAHVPNELDVHHRGEPR